MFYLRFCRICMIRAFLYSNTSSLFFMLYVSDFWLFSVFQYYWNHIIFNGFNWLCFSTVFRVFQVSQVSRQSRTCGWVQLTGGNWSNLEQACYRFSFSFSVLFSYVRIYVNNEQISYQVYSDNTMFWGKERKSIWDEVLSALILWCMPTILLSCKNLIVICTTGCPVKAYEQKLVTAKRVATANPAVAHILDLPCWPSDAPPFCNWMMRNQTLYNVRIFGQALLKIIRYKNRKYMHYQI